MSRHPERRRAHIAGRDTDELGEAAGIEVGFFERAAHRLAAAPAIVAGAARHVVRGHDAVADAEAAHAVARLDHVADDLVAEHGGNARARIGELGDVRAAEPAAAQAQQQLAGAGGGTGDVGGRQTPTAVQDDRPHASLPLGRTASMPFIQQRTAMAALRGAESVTRSSKTRNRRASISASSAK